MLFPTDEIKDTLEYEELWTMIRDLIKSNPAGKYWSPGRPEDVPLQRPEDVP